MGQDNIAIADMQCWVFRMAQMNWNITPPECAEIFRQYDLLGYISECYDVLHLSSYQHALVDIEEILEGNGVKFIGSERYGEQH